MTRNQIDYHNALETERHNKMMEAETARHQKADESLKAGANALQAQANAIQARQVAINALHLDRSDAEIQRSNMAREALTSAQNAIQSRIAQETSRHNQATEWITRSLNSSIIQKNMADTTVSYQNVPLVQERTRSEMYRQQQMEAQTKSEGFNQRFTESKTAEQAQKSDPFHYFMEHAFIPTINAIKFW